MFNEKEVVMNIRRGDARAFTLLVNEYERLVFHVVYRLTLQQADTEDVSQEVFLKVHKRIHQFAFQSKLSTWIARIAYVTAIDYMKKCRRGDMKELPENFGEAETDSDNLQHALERKDSSVYINKLIVQLPAQYRIVLTLFHLAEFSYSEVAQVTGMPEGTVKSYLFRARKLLKEKLETYLKTEN